MSNENNEHTAKTQRAITAELRRRGLSPTMARSAASLMLDEVVTAHENDDAIVSMNGRVVSVDMAVSRWLASNGREFAPQARPAPGGHASAAAPEFDLTSEDGAVNAAMYLFNASR